MSHQVKKNKKGKRGRPRAKRPCLMDLPDNILLHVLSFLDESSLEAVEAVSLRSRDLARLKKAEKKGCQGPLLDQLPTEVLTHIASYLDIKGLGRLAQVNKRFKVQSCTLGKNIRIWVKIKKNHYYFLNIPI